MHQVEPTPVVAPDVRPRAQQARNRPPVGDVPLGAQPREPVAERVPVAPPRPRAFDEAVLVVEAPLSGRDLLVQAAMVGGYALGGAALFQVGAWMVTAL